MSWILIDLDNGTEYPMSSDSEIKKYIDGLNEVTTKIDATIPDDTLVRVVDGHGNIRFTGYTKRTKTKSDDINKYTVLQKASVLAKYPLLKLSEPWCTWSAVTVTQAVDEILDYSGCGWFRATGYENSTVIDNITFYYTDVLDGLFRLIQEYMDDYLWFDDENEVVKFGQYNNDWAGQSIDYIHKDVESVSVGKGYDLVRVIGPTDSIYGSYGIHGGTAITIQKDTLANNWEATQLAVKLYRRIGTGGEYVNTPAKITLTLNPTAKYSEGDRITFEGNNYVIHQVAEKMDSTVLSLNGSNDDIDKIIEKKLQNPTYDSATSGGSGATDHGALTGLADDDHSQYLLANGNRFMSGNLSIGDNNIYDVATIYFSLDMTSSVPRIGASVTDLTMMAPGAVQLISGGTILVQVDSSGLNCNGNNIYNVGAISASSYTVNSELDLGGNDLSGITDINSEDLGSGVGSTIRLNVIEDGVDEGGITINKGEVFVSDVLTLGGRLISNDIIDMNSKRITELGNPTDAYDAVSLNYLSNYVNTHLASYMPLAGGTFSGAVQFDGALTINNDIAIGTNEILSVGNIYSSGGTFTCNTIDASNASLSVVDVGLNLDMNENDIDNVIDINSADLGSTVGSSIRLNIIEDSVQEGSLQISKNEVSTSGSLAAGEDIYANRNIFMYGDKLYLDKQSTDANSTYLQWDSVNLKLVIHLPTTNNGVDWTVG